MSRKAKKCADCKAKFDILEVNPDTLGCPECGSQNWGDCGVIA